MSQLSNSSIDLLVILGPTATGKTKLAVQLADKLSGGIISADSRQVYRGMDIGTGKDLEEYELNGYSIPYHLIDIADPMEEYNVAQFQQDFKDSFSDIHKRHKLPILCGGTGFYIKAVLMDFHLPAIAPDKKLRQELENWELEDLILQLESISPGAAKNSSLETKRRVIRAIEVEMNREKTKEKIHQVQIPFAAKTFIQYFLRIFCKYVYDSFSRKFCLNKSHSMPGKVARYDESIDF